MLTDMVVVTFMKVAGTALWLVYTVLLARLLTADDYGLVMYAVTVLTIAGPLTCFGLNSAMLRHGSVYWHQGRPAALAGLLGEARRTIVLTSLPGALLVWATFEAALGVGTAVPWSVVAIVAVGLPLYGAMDLHRETLRAVDRVLAGFLGFNILRALIPGLAAVALALAGWLTVETALAAFVCGLAVIAALDARRIAATVGHLAAVRDRFERTEWYRIARPMVLAEALGHWIARGDVVLVGALLDLRAAAIYLTAQRLAVLVTFVVDAVRLTLEPMVARRFADRDQPGLQDLMARGSLASFATGMPIALVIAGGGWLLLGLYGPDFQSGWAVLCILTLGQMTTVLAGPVSAVLRMTGLERPLTAVQFASAAGLSAAVPAGIALGGTEGAAAGAAIVTAASNLAYLAITRRRLGLRCGPGSGMFAPALVRAVLAETLRRIPTLFRTPAP
ncbi:MAG: oligosaccharide flippase family protein [Thalassobaculum sp.]|uniref:lipopolysaccharide biosynthesis protein n=1 Tax=Thalassobaculum sp. TaxID=2022740 RepID=UPI0032EC5298